MEPKYTLRLVWDDLAAIRIESSGVPQELAAMILRETARRLERKLLAEEVARAMEERRLVSRVIGAPLRS